MHARSHHWISLALAAIVVLAVGCRGSRPLANMIRISKQQDTGLQDVEAPLQRLAKNKPSVDGDARGMVTSKEVDPKTGRLVANSTPPVAPSRERPASDTISMSLADHSESESADRAARAALAAAQSRPTKPETPGPTAKLSDPISNMTEQEMAAAFESQPEYVKKMAMQQLLASMRKTAGQTTQPAALDIANSIDDLPELPVETGVKPAIPAKRIASKDSPRSSEVSKPNEPAPVQVATAPVPAEQPSPEQHAAPIEQPAADAASPATGNVVAASDSKASQPSDIQPASASQHADDVSMVAQADAEPADSRSAVDVAGLTEQSLYRELLARLSNPPAGESEADRSSRLIKQRHLMVLAGDPDAAVEKIEQMSESEQEYLRHQLLGLWTMVDPEGHPVPSRRFTTALPQMREATKFAAAATDSLEVRSLAFCTAIESYGQIKTFPGNRFDAGQQVILYCEVENFAVNTSANGYETHLQGSYDIYDQDNEKVVSQLLPADQQTSANYLRDYFIAYQMHLPQQLSAGTYRLQLTMEDVTGKKYGQASIPLEIAK